MKKELIELYEKTIPTQNFELIPLEFLCANFGLDYEYQYRLLDKDVYFDGLFSKSENESVFGDKRKRGHLNKAGFIKWILRLNPIIVNELLRDSFAQYQNNVVDYLYDNAIQQENVLKQIIYLKNQKNEIYEKLISETPEFREYINIQAEIMRLGKENKNIQIKIGGSVQSKFLFPEEE